MKPTALLSTSAPHDTLAQYASTVQSLHQKLDHIRADQQATVASLGRAAMALRSISAANHAPAPPVFKNEPSNLREFISRPLA